MRHVCSQWMLRGVLMVLTLVAGPLLGSAAWGAQDRLTGCAASTFDSRSDFPPIELSGFPTLITLLTAVLHHPCPGPVVVEAVVNAGLVPTAFDDALVAGVSTLTCIGGGCEVTGDAILPIGPGSTGQILDKTKPFELYSLAVTNLFGDVPPGTYLVDLLAFGTHASVIAVQMHVLASGTPSRAGRGESP